MIKGFTMDDEWLKNLCGGNYWKELPQRKADDVIEVEIELDEVDLTSAEGKALEYFGMV